MRTASDARKWWSGWDRTEKRYLISYMFMGTVPVVEFVLAAYYIATQQWGWAALALFWGVLLWYMIRNGWRGIYRLRESRWALEESEKMLLRRRADFEARYGFDPLDPANETRYTGGYSQRDECRCDNRPAAHVAGSPGCIWAQLS